jgi:membrane-associated phospholipid phosphatase
MAAGFSVLLSFIAASFLMIYGKNESFLVINKFNSPSFDSFFRFYTYLGDGIIWIPVFLYALFWKREFLVPVLLGVVISTVLSQFLKHVVFPDALRPNGTLKGQMHIIAGVDIYTHNSFPSGHTCTAFTLALLMAFVVRRNFWVFFFPIIAFFVGYSRVYLAEHFVTDVFAGILVGVVSAYLSLLIYEAYRRRQGSSKFQVQRSKSGEL